MFGYIKVPSVYDVYNLSIRRIWKKVKTYLIFLNIDTICINIFLITIKHI